MDLLPKFEKFITDLLYFRQEVANQRISKQSKLICFFVAPMCALHLLHRLLLVISGKAYKKESPQRPYSFHAYLPWAFPPLSPIEYIQKESPLPLLYQTALSKNMKEESYVISTNLPCFNAWWLFWSICYSCVWWWGQHKQALSFHQKDKFLCHSQNSKSLCL